MQNSKIETLIQKYLSHELNGQEFEELKQWIEEDASHKEIFVKLLSLHHVNVQVHLLHQFDKEASWENLLKRCKGNKRAQRIRTYSAVATLAIIIGISSLLYFNRREMPDTLSMENDIAKTEIPATEKKPRAILVLSDRSEVPLYLNQQEVNGSYIRNGQIIFSAENADSHDSVSIDEGILQNQVKVPRGSDYSVVLSDGTKVKLNADSHLDFPVQFAGRREVSLQGEALFEVVSDENRPFIIRANNHTISVLGTTFNVTAYPDEDVFITLVTGKVKITAPDGEYMLVPGEQYSSRTASISQVDTHLSTSWTTGIMEFDAMPLPDLLAKLSRYHDVDLKLASEELENLKFTGTLFRNKPLSFALDILHRVSDVKFEKDGETILVKKQ